MGSRRATQSQMRIIIIYILKVTAMNKRDIYNNLKQQQLQLDIDALEFRINGIELASIIDNSFNFKWADKKRQQSLGVNEAMWNLLGRDYVLNAQSNDETRELLNKWYDLNNKYTELKKNS